MRKYFTLLFSFLLSLNVYFANSLTVAQFNIDCNVTRTEEGFASEAFENWRIHKRLPYVYEFLKKMDKQNVDIINLQEARSFTNKFGEKIDAVTPVTQFLESLGYDVYTTGYNPSDRAFQYITAVRKDNLKVVSHERKYFTKTPEVATAHPDMFNMTEAEKDDAIKKIKEHNFGELWERAALLTTLEDKNGQRFYSFNVHKGITASHRLAASKLLVEWAKEIVGKDSTAKILMSGDFNSFPDWEGPKQLDIMREYLQDAADDLRFPNGDAADTSFFFFPYDYANKEREMKEEFAEFYSLADQARQTEKLEEKETILASIRKKTLEAYVKHTRGIGGKLDHLFYKGFDGAQATLLPQPLGDTPPRAWNVETIKEYVLALAQEGRPAFASDHQPILTKLRYGKDTDAEPEEKKED